MTGIRGDRVLPAVEGAHENATKVAFGHQAKNMTMKIVMSFVTTLVFMWEENVIVHLGGLEDAVQVRSFYSRTYRLFVFANTILV